MYTTHAGHSFTDSSLLYSDSHMHSCQLTYLSTLYRDASHPAATRMFDGA